MHIVNVVAYGASNESKQEEEISFFGEYPWISEFRCFLRLVGEDQQPIQTAESLFHEEEGIVTDFFGYAKNAKHFEGR